MEYIIRDDAINVVRNVRFYARRMKRHATLPSPILDP